MKKRKSSRQQKRRWPALDTFFLLNWRKLLLVIVIWALTAALIWAFFGPLNDLFGAADGPAGNNVTDILRDDDGDLLIATWGGGVSRYDGRTWQTITSQDGLADNRVSALAQTGTGTVWLGTYAGPSLLEGGQWRPYGLEDGLPSELILALAVDADDNVWLGTADGLIKYDSASGEFEFMNRFGPQPVVRTLYIDRTGRVWVGTSESGLYYFQDGDGWQNVTTADGLAHNHIEAIFEDSQGDVWVGTLDGLNRYDGHGWQLYSTADGLPANIILALAEDPAGDLLAGTSDGMARFDGRAWRPVTTGEDSPTNIVDALLVDRDGTLWAGGQGLSHFDGSTWQSYYFRAGLLATAVFLAGTVVIPIYLLMALVYTVVRTQPRSRYMRLNRYSLLLIPAFFLAILLHNLVYAMFYPYYLREGSDEGVFLMLALFAIPFYFLLIVFNTIAWLFGGRHPDEEGARSPADGKT
jgi:ligand-binding sensor domain-containing protein